ncbi:hypothetical protein Nmel_001883, partial [Mimus melanotis]
RKFCDPVTRLLLSDKQKIANFHSAVCSSNNKAAHEGHRMASDNKNYFIFSPSKLILLLFFQKGIYTTSKVKDY